MDRRTTGWVLAAGAATLAIVAIGALSRPVPVAVPPASPTPSASAAPTAPSATFTPIVTSSPATPTRDLGVEAAWLVSVRDGSVTKLAETTGDLFGWEFAPAGTEVAVGVSEGTPRTDSLVRLDLNGHVLERAAWRSPYHSPRCTVIRSIWNGPPAPGDPPPQVEVDGRPRENASCGPISPDGRWMAYWLWSSGTRQDAPQFDQWILDLASGDRRLLQPGLRFCGGCDSVPSPTWSPSSRLLYFSDVVGNGDRFFLGDVVTASARQLAHTGHAPFDVPAWSPAADLLLYSDGSGGTVMEDPAAGSKTVLADVAWPAAFDSSGTYIYSPGWVDDEAPGRVTKVFDAATHRLVASLPGQPARRTYSGVGGAPSIARPIVGTASGFVAALTGAMGCVGVAMYVDAKLVTCVARAARPLFSPDGTKIAFARWTQGEIQASRCPTACAAAELIVVDAATGVEVLSTGPGLRLTLGYTSFAGGGGFVWGPDGRYLLVVAPPAR